MLLSHEDGLLFFKLHRGLLRFVQETLKVVSIQEAQFDINELPAADLFKLTQSYVSRLELIDAFVAANPARFSVDELAIVSSWRHLVAGRFVALRQLKSHMIFLSQTEPIKAFAVLGLSQPLEQVFGARTPALIETVLLPFRDKIVCDGIVSRFNIFFGPGIRQGFEESLRTARGRGAFLTSLPEGVAEITRPARSERAGARKAVAKPAPNAKELLQQVVSLTDAFCQSHLTDEYAVLCRAVAEKLARKRPSPLLRGDLKAWGCAIVRVIAWVNFLQDRTQRPHLPLPAIDQAFGVGTSTAQAKATTIRRMLKIQQCDHKWTLPSRWDSTTPIWMLQVPPGYVVDHSATTGRDAARCLSPGADPVRSGGPARSGQAGGAFQRQVGLALPIQGRAPRHRAAGVAADSGV